MIIGEAMNYYGGHAEERYDYLFKRKSSTPTPRQQQKALRKALKKEEKKSLLPGRKPGKLVQKRQDRKAGLLPKKRLIQGNFGLFNPNKRKEEAARSAQPVPLSEPEPENSDIPSFPEETTPAPATGAEDPGENTYPEPTESTPDDVESYYDEGSPASTKTESKTADKDVPKKQKESNVWIGWTFLGLTVGVIAYTLYSLERTSKKTLQLVEKAAGTKI